MTPVSVPQNQLGHERRSAALVTALLLVCLLLGWLVKTTIQNDTRSVEYGDFTAAVPAGWLVQEGAGDLIFIVRNPQAFDQLYRVTQLPAAADLELVAENRNLARTRLDSTFRVLESSPVVFAGQDAYKVSFARADVDSPGMPTIIEGIDYYFAQNDQVMVLSLESQDETFAEAVPNFQTFVQSVSYRAGE
ncbi:MAG: hypothetical protein DHS20C20_28100 [Ardenticatenaceae bacterium]|nr:MAG: hypothetical protein DHS20C20_28100 [Ardenticatenaceae bacterium]